VSVQNHSTAARHEVKTYSVDEEQAVQELVDKYNFQPEKKYRLQRIQEVNGKNGGTLWNNKKYKPIRNIHLPRNPVKGRSIYDLHDQDDFKQYFEEEFGNLPNGLYTAMTSKGGNDGFAWLFLLRLENGNVVNWWKKSKATNPRQHSSTYYALPYYFQLREELGV
jgi:hypothetical protein